jgi:hypothetical protein
MTTIGFVRRENSDETIDSICLNCYRTVASVQVPSDLESVEERHVCNPVVKLQYRHLRPESV